MENADNIKFRCHYLGEIMTDPRGKSNREKLVEVSGVAEKLRQEYGLMDPSTKRAAKKLLSLEKVVREMTELDKVKDEILLSDTCRKRLAKIYAEHAWGKSRDLVSNAIEKGLAMEEAGLDLVSEVTGNFYVKNKFRFEDEHLTGEADVVEGEDKRDADYVRDIKCSYDYESFLMHYSGEADESHIWQVHGYMALYGAKESYIDYCLVNTPGHIVQSEIRAASWRLGIIDDSAPEFQNLARKIEANHNFDNIPAKKRLKTIHVERDEERIERIYDRIFECKKFMNQIYFNQ